MSTSGYLPNLLGPVVIAVDGVDQTARPTINFVNCTGTDDAVNDRLDITPDAGAGSTPTGTGIPHVVGGVQNAAASLIVNADVHAAAAIAISKLAPIAASDIASGTLVHERGGLEADVSAYSGLVKIAGGATSAVTAAAGVETFITTPSSANLASAVTDETGSGALVFANTPTLVTPVIGAATGTSLVLSSTLTVGGAIIARAQIVGDNTTSSPYSVHSVAGHTFAADADYTVLAAQYAADYNYFATGSWASGHTVTYPAAPSNISYYKTIENRTAYDMTLTASGSIVTRVLPAGYTVRCVITENSDLKFIGAPYHMTTGRLAIPDVNGDLYYKILGSDLAAHRDVTLPLLTGNDTFVFEAHAATLTNKTISLGSNTVTCTSAQLATACSDETGSGALVFANTPTLVAPEIGAATGTSLAATSFVSVGGGTPSAAGHIRLPYAAIDVVISAKDSVGTDRSFLHRTGADVWQFGGGSIAYSVYWDSYNAITWGHNYWSVAAGGAGNSVLSSYGSSVLVGLPMVGDTAAVSPHGVHGGVAFTFAADANYVVTAAQYALDWLEFVTGVITAGRTVTFPHPASKAAGYYKTIFNNTNQTLTVATGTGTTKTITTGLAQRFWFDNAGVSFASATFTP